MLQQYFCNEYITTQKLKKMALFYVSHVMNNLLSVPLGLRNWGIQFVFQVVIDSALHIYCK